MDHDGATLGPCGTHVGPVLVHVGDLLVQKAEDLSLDLKASITKMSLGFCGHAGAAMLGQCWGHLGPISGQQRRVKLNLGNEAQRHMPALGHVGAMLGLLWEVYVGRYLWAL